MITQKELKELLHYNPITGDFTWIVSRGYVRNNGVAGCDTIYGYRSIKINQKRYQSHRLAWLHVYGEWPKDQIDHINHVRNDNRICNLRSVTRKENLKNKRAYKASKTGVSGVTLYKPNGRWKVTIGSGYSSGYIGYFTDWFEAICARKSAENKHKYHKNNGTI